MYFPFFSGFFVWHFYALFIYSLYNFKRERVTRKSAFFSTRTGATLNLESPRQILNLPSFAEHGQSETECRETSIVFIPMRRFSGDSKPFVYRRQSTPLSLIRCSFRNRRAKESANLRTNREMLKTEHETKTVRWNKGRIKQKLRCRIFLHRSCLRSINFKFAMI